LPTRNGKLKTGLLARESLANLASPLPCFFSLALLRCTAVFVSASNSTISVAWQRVLRRRAWKWADVDAIFGIFAMTTSKLNKTENKKPKPVRKRNKFWAMTPQLPLPFAFYVFMLKN